LVACFFIFIGAFFQSKFSHGNHALEEEEKKLAAFEVKAQRGFLSLFSAFYFARYLARGGEVLSVTFLALLVFSFGNLTPL
jgi:hypothetical protein